MCQYDYHKKFYIDIFGGSIRPSSSKLFAELTSKTLRRLIQPKLDKFIFARYKFMGRIPQKSFIFLRSLLYSNVTFHLLNLYLKLYLTMSESKIRKITVKKL